MLVICFGSSMIEIWIKENGEEKKIVFIVDETVNCGKIGLKIVFTTSTGLTGYLPIKKDAKKRIILCENNR